MILTHMYCRIFFTLNSKGVAYTNFISDLLSVVLAVYTELIRFFEMVCLIKVAVRQYRPL